MIKNNRKDSKINRNRRLLNKTKIKKTKAIKKVVRINKNIKKNRVKKIIKSSK